jgi:RNA polymerase sigma-70 factor, ECF subfamily
MSSSGEETFVRKQCEGDTSLSLIDRVRAKEQDAWRQFTDLYGPLVYHWCRTRELPPEDAADIVQEVFRSVAANIETFEKDEQTGSFRGWLWTITRNKIFDLWKNRRGEAVAVGGSEAHERLQSIPETEPPEADEPSTGTSALVLRAAEMIRPEFQTHTWQAFWRVTVDDIDPATVAEELGMKVGSVFQAKSRVLKRLREYLE